MDRNLSTVRLHGDLDYDRVTLYWKKFSENNLEYGYFNNWRVPNWRFMGNYAFIIKLADRFGDEKKISRRQKFHLWHHEDLHTYINH